MIVGNGWSSMDIGWLRDHFGNRLGNGDLLYWLWDLDVGWFTVDYSIETVVIISSVFDGTLVSISIDQTVLAMDLIAVTGFVLILDVSGVFIVHSIGEVVLSVVIVVQFNLFHQRWLSDGLHDCRLSNCFHICWLGNSFQEGWLWFVMVSNVSWLMV